MSNIISWANDHGGILAVVLIILLGVNALLSGISAAMEKIGGLFKSPAIGVADSLVVKIIAKIQLAIDWIQGNRPH